MSNSCADETPNAATSTQTMLKRLERAIRRRSDCGLLLTLDGISLLKEPDQVRESLLAVQRRLESL